jgi:glyoxylase-like metal-dependent hydrolase (beta-lactamase superfamily II)
MAYVDALAFEQFRAGEGNLSYVVGDLGSGGALLVDPEAEAEPAYRRFVDERGLRVVAIVDTHTHADHVSSAGDWAAREGVPYVMHAAAPTARATRRVRDGDRIEAGPDVAATVLEVPGHTADLMALVFEDRVLTGDALFIGGSGRTDLPGGSAEDAFRSLRRLAALPGELRVYPGHDYRGRAYSTIAQERATNPRLRVASAEELDRLVRDEAKPRPSLYDESMAANTR